MDCSKCQHDEGGPIQELFGIGVQLYLACQGATWADIEITCKRFTPKKITVDPNATCGDCGLYLRDNERCKKGHMVTGCQVACVKIQPKETTL